MYIVFHERFREVYDTDPAAAEGRLEQAVTKLRPLYPFVEPQPAKEEDILLVHTPWHVEYVKKQPRIYEMALLAAGGAIKAAELAMAGTPAFGLIRPPGHHAGPNRCWGFCWFNNIALAVARLLQKGQIEKAVIVDIDLHFGDGTQDIFAGNKKVSYWHVRGRSLAEYLQELRDFLVTTGESDVIAISAGFDRHALDWGAFLETEDYHSIGQIIGEHARSYSKGRVFAVLEGGYNHSVLGESICALLTGLNEGLKGGPGW